MSSTTGSGGNSIDVSNCSKRGRASLRKEKERSRRISDGDDDSPKRNNRARAASTSSTEREDFERGSWECTVCTYRNPSEAFRCEVCDVRKGTSTRKPRLNSTVVEQQQTVQKFVQQQQAAMMAQANREKKTTSEKPATGGASPPQTPSSTLSAPAGPSGCCSRSRSVSPSCSLQAAGRSSPSPQCPSQLNHSLQPAPAACSSSPSPSSSPSSSGQKKVLLNSPSAGPASSPKRSTNARASNRGACTAFSRRVRRSGAKLAAAKSSRLPDARLISNVDQNSARTLAVTVNGITVVITDYKLRPGDGDDGDAVAAAANADDNRMSGASNGKTKHRAAGKATKKRKSRSSSTSDQEEARGRSEDEKDAPRSAPMLDSEDQCDSELDSERRRTKVKLNNSRSSNGCKNNKTGKRKTPTPMEQANGRDNPADTAPS